MAVTGDGRSDVGGDCRWMTYAELAEARGIKEPAAVRLVQRRRWERQPGNDGSARVAVPLSELRPTKAITPAVPLVAPDSYDTESLTRERQRADRAEAGQAALQGRLDQVERDRDQARQEREAARVEAAGATGEARALREALAEARRPAWRRWLGLP